MEGVKNTEKRKKSGRREQSNSFCKWSGSYRLHQKNFKQIQGTRNNRLNVSVVGEMHLPKTAGLCPPGDAKYVGLDSVQAKVRLSGNQKLEKASLGLGLRGGNFNFKKQTGEQKINLVLCSEKNPDVVNYLLGWGKSPSMLP